MTTSHTTTTVGSIPITGGTSNQPPALTRPATPDPSDKERKLELQLERAREKRKAKEEAKKKAEEEAARRAAEAGGCRLGPAAANHNCSGPPPGQASTSTRRVEVEITHRVSGGDPNGGDDGGNDDKDNEGGQGALQEVSIEEDPLPRTVQVKREGGPSGEWMAIMESQMAQGLANAWSLREAMTRTNQLSMAGSATLEPSRTASEKPRLLKRRRVEEETEDDEEEEKGEEEEDEQAPKKARLEKGKEREE
ncbi:hypothetical protein EV359DRAFT_87880 [Lentinula novae-zelandiae]|nr:hypothetical protein EV359DRAFT_87880 [Lentinula novae-zelandiae]